MKKLLIPSLLAVLLLASCANDKAGTFGNAVDGYPITPVPFTSREACRRWPQKVSGATLTEVKGTGVMG